LQLLLDRSGRVRRLDGGRNFRVLRRIVHVRCGLRRDCQRFGIDAFFCGRGRTMRSPGPADAMPPEYWESVLNDPRADARADRSGPSIRTQRLSEIPQHILRVSCSRCDRIVEIQKADAVRLYGTNAICKDVAPRMLDNTCQQRTGSHKEDGCWPSFE
jgi:hypothetical protein